MEELKLSDGKISYLISGKDGESFFPDIPLEIDFDRNAKLEYSNSKPYSKRYNNHKKWSEMGAYTFRSWGGDRRINGKRFYGNVYYLGSNKISRKGENKNV